MSIPGLGLAEPEEQPVFTSAEHSLAAGSEWRFEIAIGKHVTIKVRQISPNLVCYTRGNRNSFKPLPPTSPIIFISAPKDWLSENWFPPLTLLTAPDGFGRGLRHRTRNITTVHLHGHQSRALHVAWLYLWHLWRRPLERIHRRRDPPSAIRQRALCP